MGEMKTYQVTVKGKTCAYPEGTLYEQIAAEQAKAYKAPIILARAGGKLCELTNRLHQDVTLDFVTMTETAGIQSYHRSVKLLALYAFYKVAGHENVEKITVEFSVSRGLYLEPEGNFELGGALLEKVEKKI